MADKIINITREDNSDSTTHCWHIAYEVEDSGDTNQFVQIVLASEMVDDTSESEAKTLANAKAAIKKAAWITAKATTSISTATTTTEESVTL